MHKKLCLSVCATVSASIALPAAQSSSHANAQERTTAISLPYKSCVHWFASRSPTDGPAFRVLSSEIGCYDGQISSQLTTQILRWLSSANGSPLLAIRSPGGSVDDALPIGRMILRKKARVAVSGLCASSCANYILSTARKRLILPNSIVLFHGGVSPGTIEEAAGQVREQLKLRKFAPDKIEASVDRTRRKLGDQLAEQRKLMMDAGVDPQFLERFGDIDPAAIDSSKCTPGTDRVGFFLSRPQLRQIGIIVSGPVPHSAAEAAAVLRILGNPDWSVCLAPAALVDGS